MELPELQARLIDDARRYDPATQARTLLGPHRTALLLYRAKFMSYEQIAAALLRNGLKVSPAAVGVFCRRHFTKTQVLRERRRLEVEVSRATTRSESTPRTPPGRGTEEVLGRRGPKIARDDF